MANTSIDVGIGPMSLEVIDAIIEYANDKKREIMLIASRNQIESVHLGGGYVGGLNTDTFASHVRSKDSGKFIKLCRDHSGPYLNAADKELSLEKAILNTKISLENDINAGFDLLHIDPSAAPDPHAAATELFQHAVDATVKSRRKVEFEFGSEENVGVAVSADKFEKDILFAKQFIEPKYVVGQTGSLVKSIYQVGVFNEKLVKQLVETADKHNVKLKEHNADYLNKEDILKKIEIGIGAINIAPEFGVLHTQVITRLAVKYGYHQYLEDFKNYVIRADKWKKWAWGDFDDNHKYLASAHYHFTSSEYLRLADVLDQLVDDHVYNAIKINTYEALDKYIV